MSTIDTSRFGWAEGFDKTDIKEWVSLFIRAESVPITVWLAIITILIGGYLVYPWIFETTYTHAEIRGFFQKGPSRWMFMGFMLVLIFIGSCAFDIPYSVFL